MSFSSPGGYHLLISPRDTGLGREVAVEGCGCSSHPACKERVRPPASPAGEMLQRTNDPAHPPRSDLLPAPISTATSAKGSSLLQEFTWVAFMVKIKREQNPSNAGWGWLPAAVVSAMLGRCASSLQQLAIWGDGPQMEVKPRGTRP